MATDASLRLRFTTNVPSAYRVSAHLCNAVVCRCCCVAVHARAFFRQVEQACGTPPRDVDAQAVGSRRGVWSAAQHKCRSPRAQPAMRAQHRPTTLLLLLPRPLQPFVAALPADPTPQPRVTTNGHGRATQVQPSPEPHLPQHLQLGVLRRAERHGSGLGPQQRPGAARGALLRVGGALAPRPLLHGQQRLTKLGPVGPTRERCV
mmetsp:Transcript_30608/g.90785  ORF Transcript_30608/g.90785 Transcript_30608/m.90785 type:complete len:205 (-) Transcript_30608:2017-2631(-)